MKDLYTENHKVLMKEIEDINKWKDIPCSCIERINTVKSIQPKTIYRSNAIILKIPMAFSTYREPKNLKICMKPPRP